MYNILVATENDNTHILFNTTWYVGRYQSIATNKYKVRSTYLLPKVYQYYKMYIKYR